MTRRALLLTLFRLGWPAALVAADLHSPLVRTLAQPDSVPAGVHTRRFLARTGLWARVAPRVVPVESVRAALAAVEAGNADAAFVDATDAAISKRVRIAFVVPPEAAPRIVDVAAVPTGAPHAEQARRLLDFLASPEAAGVFRRYGFLAPPPPVP